MPVSNGVPKEVIVILNRSAGSVATDRDAAEPKAVADAFATEGIRARVMMAGPDRLEHELRTAIEQRPAALFVGGGDGTLSAAAAYLAGTGVPLGVLPLGTLNHFARDLRLPADWRPAVKALAAGEAREVDIGDVNGRVFINNCSVGVYAEAVRKRDLLRTQRGLGKWRAMWLASWRVFRGMRRMRVQLAVDEVVLDLRTPLLVISNNRYTGHVLDGCVRAQLDAGQLWLHTTRVHRRFTLLRLALQALRRRLDQVDHLETLPFSEGVLNSAHPLPVAADGELLPVQTPLRFRIRPRALKVLVPRRA